MHDKNTAVKMDFRVIKMWNEERENEKSCFPFPPPLFCAFRRMRCKHPVAIVPSRETRFRVALVIGLRTVTSDQTVYNNSSLSFSTRRCDIVE